MKNTPTSIINTEKETRSFFWFMTLILTGLTIFTIVSQDNLHSLKTIIPIVLLMTVHIILHWMLRYFLDKRGWTIGYMLVQGAITAVLILITKNSGVAMGLTLALLGEAIGVYGLTKRGLFAGVFYFCISLGFFVWIVGVNELVWWVIATVPMIVFVVLYVELYSRQAKANEKAQELLSELETTNQQLTEYAAQVEDLTIASERQRMARELHDTLSQGLAGLILQLEAVDANLAGGKTDRSRQIVQQAMESARQTLYEARLAIDDLRQGQLTGCGDDLEKKVAHFIKNSGISCEYNCELSEELSSSVADAVVGVVTESLMNITKHAAAKKVKVNLEMVDGSLNLEIQDDGRGFDPSAVPVGGHYGLIGMRERVSLVNGSFEVISQPGAGTFIKVRIPCS